MKKETSIGGCRRENIRTIEKWKWVTLGVVMLKRTCASLEVPPDSQPAPPSMMHVHITSNAWSCPQSSFYGQKYGHYSTTSREFKDTSLLYLAGKSELKGVVLVLGSSYFDHLQCNCRAWWDINLWFKDPLCESKDRYSSNCHTVDFMSSVNGFEFTAELGFIHWLTCCF